MIIDSYPYFIFLEDYVESFRAIDFGTITELEMDEFLFKLERDTFYSAFIIRKLIESGKVADSFSHIEVNLPYYQAINDGKGWRLDSIEKHYNLQPSSRNNERRKIGYLLNQIIHSRVFLFHLDGPEDNPDKVHPTKLLGILCNSDTSSKSKLYEIPWDMWIEVIKKIQHYDVDTIHRFKNEDGIYEECRFNSVVDKDSKEFKHLSETKK